jgi:5-methyltetrahydropteroyltriglutamate--homocysteine methyltransferase
VGLAKPADAESPFKRSAAVEALLPAYEAVLKELAGLGVPEVQLHEPILTHSDAASLKADFEATYKALAAIGVPINLVRVKPTTPLKPIP